MDRFINNISGKYLYIIAIVSVALLIIANQLILQVLLKERSKDAVVINLAGKQRMLSQRILNMSHEVQESPSALPELKREVDEWVYVHRALQSGDQKLGLPPLENQAIRDLFHNLDPYIERVQAIVASAQNPEDIIQDKANMESALEAYLPLMDEIVSSFQQASEDHINDLVIIEILLALFSILILILEVQYIFKPILNENRIKADKLEQLNQTKDRILATIVHDLRSPMTGIIGLRNLLYEELEEDLTEEQQMMFSLMEDASNNADELIRELLEISVLEGDQVHLDMKATRLEEYIMSILAQFKNKAKEKGVNLKVSTSGEDLIVSLDPLRFSRVLDNLLSNALKFTASPGTVEIETIEKENTVIIKVKDTGIGIPKELHGFLFDKFSKARRLGLQGEKTTGLGMSIVKQIVELHEGSIWFESEEDKGTEFFIRLPKAKEVA